ncbi:sigma factor [Streptodolium elevatio]|uniref:Sigma factor n=1 Tax=Streptodolium elevatio TaxID=3157996 RepID=A0ABV3DQN8_9ACTN
MGEDGFLAARFAGDRARLRAVAYRMLGSSDEADDALREVSRRLGRTDVRGVENLSGWLTVVVGRVCLDRLRSRDAAAPESSRGERAWDERTFGPVDPEETAQQADTVVVALLAALGSVSPDERLAFVMHDVFALPFDEVADVVGGTPTAARQLGSGTRRLLQGESAGRVGPAADRVRRRQVVEEFHAASRQRDFAALRSLLDPDAVLRTDTAADEGAGALGLVRGARAVAEAFAAHIRAHVSATVDGNVNVNAQDARVATAFVDGEPGLVCGPVGWPTAAFAFTFSRDSGRVTCVDVLADPDPDRLAERDDFVPESRSVVAGEGGAGVDADRRVVDDNERGQVGAVAESFVEPGELDGSEVS